MKTVPRWSETGVPNAPGLQSALQDARRGPRPEQLAGLSARVAARLAERARAASPPLAAVRIGRRWRGWLMCVGLTMLAATAWWRVASPEHGPATPPSRAPLRATPPARVAAERSPAELAAEPDSVAVRAVTKAAQAPAKAAESSERPRPRAVRPARAAPRPAQAGDEVSLLQSAQRALMVAPARALSFVRQHQEQFPAGLFVEEREAIRIEALWRTHRYDEAEQRHASFVRIYPRSTYRERLERFRRPAQ
jgi:hypothetical protein